MPIFQKAVLKNAIIDNAFMKEKARKGFAEYQRRFSAERIEEIKKLKEEEYQDGFLRDLFVDILGYKLRPDEGYNLVRERKNQTNSQKADAAVLREGRVIAVVELKSNSTKDVAAITVQAFGYKNNNAGCRYVLTSNFQYLRLYIDDATEFEEFDLYNITLERFQVLFLLLHQNSLFDDLPAKLKQASAEHEKRITDKLYRDYKNFRDDLFANLCQYNKSYDKLTLFKKTQKLLDRLLFVFFAEDAGLIPPNAIKLMLDQQQDLRENHDEHVSLYSRFQKLFRHLDKGHRYKRYGQIPAYNGGLFRVDEILDAADFRVSDGILATHCTQIAAYDFSSEVDVNILGHIFEHSMGEAEALAAELEGTEIDRQKTRRKKDGVFYTPRYITRYMVDNTLGKLCAEQKTALGIASGITVEAETTEAEKTNLLQRLQAYKTWLLGLRILDPACGSGAFLNQTLDFLIAEHRHLSALFDALKGAPVLDEYERELLEAANDDDKRILENNIFGVDINEESVQIARLSLWLRTARRGRALSGLSENIKCGNSLIDDANVAGEKAFNWQQEFPQIMQAGGFDVVLGNPPYRIVFEEPLKSTLETLYPVFKRNNDLYVAFFAQFLNLTKANGFCGLITPNTYVRGEYFLELRRSLIKFQISEIVDFGNKIVFEDANVYTAIAAIRKAACEIGWLMKSDLDSVKGYVTPETEQFIARNGTFSKLATYPKFNQYLLVKDVGYNYWAEGRGKTRGGDSIGSRVFYTGQKKYKDDIPYLKGAQVQRYSLAQPIHFLRHNYSELLQTGDTFRFSAEILQTRPKLIYRQTSSLPIAAIDLNGYHTDKTLHTILAKSEFAEKIDLSYVLTLLNSRLLLFYYRTLTEEEGRAFAQVKTVYIKDLPFVFCSPEAQAPFVRKAEAMFALNERLQKAAERFQKRLVANFAVKITTKIEEFYLLDFRSFLAELKKQKVEISLKAQDEWQAYFEESSAEIKNIRSEIAATDAEINKMVYALYGITAEEIALIEA